MKSYITLQRYYVTTVTFPSVFYASMEIGIYVIHFYSLSMHHNIAFGLSVSGVSVCDQIL